MVKKSEVVAAVPVAFTKVKFWRVVEAVTRKFWAVARPVVFKEKMMEPSIPPVRNDSGPSVVSVCIDQSPPELKLMDDLSSPPPARVTPISPLPELLLILIPDELPVLGFNKIVRGNPGTFVPIPTFLSASTTNPVPPTVRSDE